MYEPTLKKALERIEKHKGHFKGRGDGTVKFEENDDNDGGKDEKKEK